MQAQSALKRVKDWRARHSGERSLPGRTRPAVFCAAMARYRFSLPLCEGKRVLDIGCGCGAGLEIISLRARETVGLDYSVETLLSYPYSPRESWICHVGGDAIALPFRDGAFDVVTAFEVIEHLEEPVRLLRESRRVLAPDGVLILSTPNRPVYSPSGTWLDYHVREYDAGELLAMLEPHFSSVDLKGQAHLSRDARLDCSPLNRFFYPIKRSLDPRGVVANRLRAAYVYLLWGEKPADCTEAQFPVISRDVERLPILVAVCRVGEGEKGSSNETAG